MKDLPFETPWMRRFATATDLFRTLQNVFVTLAGIAAIVWTPRTIEGPIGDVILVFWVTFLLVGGAVAAYGAARRRQRVELPALWAGAGGIGIYAIIVWSLALETPSRTLQALILTGATCAWLARAFDLWGRELLERAMGKATDTTSEA